MNIKFLLFPIFFSINMPVIAQTNKEFQKVSNCDSDYYNEGFCLKKNIIKYKNALKTQSANFDKKFILLNIGDEKNLVFIALDTQTGIGYPLNLLFTGMENNIGDQLKNPSYTFSFDSPKLCITGSQYDGDHTGTHETYSNIKNCFKIETNGNHTRFETIYDDRINYSYDESTQTWKILES